MVSFCGSYFSLNVNRHLLSTVILRAGTQRLCVVQNGQTKVRAEGGGWGGRVGMVLSKVEQGVDCLVNTAEDLIRKATGNWW